MQCRLIPAKPTAPAIFHRDNAPFTKLLSSLFEVLTILQEVVRSSEVLCFESRGAIHEQAAQAYKRVRPKFAPAPGILNVLSVRNEMNPSVRSLKHQIAAPGCLVFAVHKDPAFDVLSTDVVMPGAMSAIQGT